MALSLRRVLSLAVGMASSNWLSVEAGGAEMLVKPDRDIHQALYRALKDDDDMNTTMTTTEEPTETTGEAKTSEAATTEEEAAAKAKAVITGTATMSVANATEFCANDAAMEAIEKVMKEETGAADVMLECMATERRLNEGASRRLQESVTLAYTITIEAESESSPEVLSVMDKLEALDASTLQTLIQAELDAANIDVDVTVLEFSAPQVQIEMPTTTTAQGPTDASSGLSLGLCSLIVATVLSFALHL